MTGNSGRLSPAAPAAAIEVFQGRGSVLASIGAGEVRDALGELKAMKLLGRFRGAAAKDFDALIEYCVRFGAFVGAADGLFAAIDLNAASARPRGRRVRTGDELIEMRACAE